MRPRRRSGMSLIEVMVAMLLLTGVLLALGGFMTKFSQASNQANLVLLANELAVKRLDEVRQQPNYLAVQNMAGKRSVRSEGRVFTESTYVLRTGGAVLDPVDYMTVTTVILQDAMQKRVSKTTAVAAF
jgi:prepilin-type N-terminal cleavage/methylation domain-containing protein